METPLDGAPRLTEASKQVARQALVICENRIELLLVELQEERERIVRALWMLVGVAAFGLLAGIAATALIAAAFWETSPIIALILLTLLYAGVAVFLGVRLNRFQQRWQTLPETLDQMRKDRECLKKSLG